MCAGDEESVCECVGELPHLSWPVERWQYEARERRPSRAVMVQLTHSGATPPCLGRGGGSNTHTVGTK